MPLPLRIPALWIRLVMCVACISFAPARDHRYTLGSSADVDSDGAQQTVTLSLPAHVNQVRFYSAFQGRLVRQECRDEGRAKGDGPLKQCMDDRRLAYKLPKVAASVPRCMADWVAQGKPQQNALKECLGERGTSGGHTRWGGGRNER